MEDNENLEVLEETTPEETENNDNESALVPEPVPDPEQTEDSLEELLEEFIQNRIAEQNENSEEIETLETENSSEVVVSDYSDYYSQIIELLGENQLELEGLSTAYENYVDNNNLQSEISDISLSNMLSIILIISILFTALLNFSRRIF